MLDIPRNFSVTDYMDYIFDSKRMNIDVVEWVDSDFHEHVYFKVLNDIYAQIKKNLKR